MLQRIDGIGTTYESKDQCTLKMLKMVYPH